MSADAKCKHSPKVLRSLPNGHTSVWGIADDLKTPVDRDE
jgi:hypothetical protein